VQKADCDLFVTFCCAWIRPMPAAARDLVLEHCIREHEKRIRLYAVVVMPNHVHLLLSRGAIRMAGRFRWSISCSA
jgi:REP element-mobilizing transposase RayT